MVNIGVPDFNVGYNSSEGSFHNIGNSGNIYHRNQFDPAQNAVNSINEMRNFHAYSQGSQAQWNNHINHSISNVSLSLPAYDLAATNGGGDWHPPMALKEVGSAASYASGAIGLTQIGMLEYRMSLPIMSKIGTFGTFSSTYRGLGVASKTLGRTATYIGAPLSIGLDYSAYRSGDISLGRFGYRTGSLGVSIGTGAAIGGPWGAAAGAAVGGISVGAEYIYDNFLVPLGNEIQYQIWNFENAIRNGWYPGR